VTAVDIYILGTGMVGYRQLTRECEQTLERLDLVYVLHPLPEVRAFIRERCESVIDLTDEYGRGRERAESYEVMASRVLDGAAEVDGAVGLAIYGHPTVGVTPTRLVRAGAADRDFTVEVLPGVSSLDCLYAEFDIDPVDRGVQMFDATDLLVYDIALDPATPALLVQVGLTGTRLCDSGDDVPRLDALERHLSNFYPDTHRVHFVRVATLPFADSKRLSISIDSLESVADEIEDAHTLVIPPTEERRVEDESLAADAYASDRTTGQ
jgi:uncharacterized protein YabN with tetrapyrrole methylase and pyrophosphatase domain